jgi:hypothetical protein
MVHPYFKNMVEDVMGGAPFAIGDVVQHPDGYEVKITDGAYWGHRGLSNFWYWKRVNDDGTLSETTEHGYGWIPESQSAPSPR